MYDWCGNFLTIGDLEVRSPIVQGGMGVGVSGSGLATAVANEGGIGVISAVGLGYLQSLKSLNPSDIGREGESLNIKFLRNEIRNARQRTKGILGVNIMVVISEFSQTVQAAIEEGIDVIFAGAGLPLDLPSFLKEGCKTKLVPIVSSAKAVKLICKKWYKKYGYIPDGFVVEGPMAGGHLGFKVENIEKPEFQLENLIKEVVEQTRMIEEEYGKKIAVIAAGGVYTGMDIARFIKLGASGVQMATRFVATEECDAADEFKQAYVNCKKEDIGIIKSPVGLPGRAIIGEFLSSAIKGNQRPKICPRDCITTCEKEKTLYCISSALINAVRGNMKKGFAFIGSNGYRVNKVVTVKELFKELADEFRQGIDEQKEGTICDE